MTTSLAEQLNRLRAPQTSLLLQDKKRPSLLFDPKDAANLDRETVLNIGLSGLKELIKLSNLFEEFEGTLFAQSSLNLERAVQGSKLNKKLDANIEKFLILLAPYFLLDYSHKALEWLIRRFRIHQYNKDQFLLLILPFYETRMFARALQLVDVSDATDKWHWLKSVQKTRGPLSSLVLINRMTSDNGFFKLICNHVINATKIYGSQATSLATLYNFYTSTLIKSINRITTISDIQINHLLPALVSGLSSSIQDFAAGSYMIFFTLNTKVKLKDDTIDYLLYKSFKRSSMHYGTLLFLISFYNSYTNPLETISDRLVVRLSNLSWFIENLIKIKSSGVKTSKFIGLLLESALRYILINPNESENVEKMMDDIFQKVSLDDEVDIFLTSILKNKLVNLVRTEESKQYLMNLYKSLEKSYPNKFDEMLKKIMNSCDNNEDAKENLKFLMSWHDGARDSEGSLEILNNLSHANSEQRILALKIISKNSIVISENFQDLIYQTLLARFNDDDDHVIGTLLSFSTKRLKELFSVQVLVEKLMILVSKCNAKNRKIVAEPAIKILLEICDNGEDASVFLVVLPYIFPIVNDHVKISLEILDSNFGKRNKFFRTLKKELEEDLNKRRNESVEKLSNLEQIKLIANEEKESKMIAEWLVSMSFHSLLNKDLLPPTDIIINTMKQQMNGDAAFLFFNMLLLGSVCRVPVGSLSFDVAKEAIELVSEMLKNYKNVRLLPDTSHLTDQKMPEALSLTSKGILPLQAGTYVLEMIHRRLDFKSESFMFDFENDEERSKLIVRLIEIYLNGTNNKKTKSHYMWCLKIFFQRHFADLQNLLQFLSQLFNEPVKKEISYHALEMTLQLLNDCKSFQWIFKDEIFISNLLISLTSKINKCRGISVNILKKISQTFNLKGEGFFTLLQELSMRSHEIDMDSEQCSLILYFLLSPDPDVRHLLNDDVREKLNEAQKMLFDVIRNEKIPIHLIAQLLDCLINVNGATILKLLAPLGLKFLAMAKKQPENKYISIGLTNILQRINSSCVSALQCKDVWKLFEMSLSDHTSQILVKNTLKSPSMIIIKQIDETFFENLNKISPQLQRNLFSKLIDVITDCEVNIVSSKASKAFRRIKIDAQFIVNELKEMTKSDLKKIETKTKRKLNQVSQNPDLINTHKWKRGITLLEFIKTATNIENEKILILPLFDLLRTCLSFEIQDPVEYTNQLVLSALHLLSTKSLPIQGAHLHIALIAECIRISRNPQTHYYALSLLVELFKVADTQSALNNIMPIFTFMGSSVLRQEDSYSIQITSKTIETIIPVVNAGNDENKTCEILRLFITSLPDIPEHRRIPIFVKLLQFLENYIHLYFLLTFESHVLSEQNNIQGRAQKMEFAQQISLEFSSQKMINICVKLVQFLKILPIEIDDDRQKIRKHGFKNNHIFNVEKNSPKQLRHYKYTIVQFLSQLLSRTEFINQIAELDLETMNELMCDFDKLIIELVLMIQSTSKSVELHQGKPKGKYWKILLRHLYDILDLVNSLLPNKAFIESIKRLVSHELLSVRRKALELLNARLQQRNFGEQDHDDLLSLMDSFLDILKGPHKLLSQEMEIIQQTALISIKLLAKFLATEHPQNFKPILELTINLVKNRNGPVLGSATACIGELCSSMRIHAIYSLNKFFPAILTLLEKQIYQEVPDLIMISIVCALQKIVDTMANLISPYFDQLLFELSRLNSLYIDSENPKIGIVVSRLKATGNKLASSVPLRVLLPAVKNTYDELLSKKKYKYIDPLLGILAESFTNIQASDLNTAMPNLITFFLNILEFREQVVKSEDMEIDDDIGVALSDMKNVEESASKTMVALIFKLNEDTFRPFYYRLYDWAARNPHHKHRNITFYRLSATIADSLKSLFVLFAGHFLKHAALLLSANNLSINDEIQETTIDDESSRIELIEVILLTLLRVFSYNAHDFLTQERFSILLQPIVDQIENTMGTKEEYEKRSNELIVPCVASFAAATSDDSLHKQLVYQILLKSRHTKAYVRNSALNSIVEIARKLGEEFMPLLPETVPFLAELLEDEDEVTEKNAQNAVRTLEEILGEPLQKYF
ncbi:HEAT repeat-containing protein 1 [Leptopilina boulardi]|uniref:HEAT repeat-containing protein 1 n=1 Tax=Leptopilina boulardi TaxID=63433 RepID=UPI0021F62C03|nr:HEAT repeat-containing protein 1 [Leptopilina boulardi]